MLSNNKKPDKPYEFFDVTADIGFYPMEIP